MKQEDLIAMAREADLWLTSEERIAAVERFASLVAARTREECAKDSARLDWMEKNAGQHTVCIGGKWYVRKGYGFPHIRTANLRTAIDNSIRSMGEQA